MSSPYLKSDESIILTTDRVNINSVQYEVLLTTRNLILVDIRYAQFQPQTIPLSTILSVKGGKIATGELVITLSFSDTGSTGDSGPMVLIFSQQPGEQRKRERDEWLKKLMELIVSVRQETTNTGLPTADEEGGIRPSVRRSVAHEKMPPYTTVIDTRPVPVELTILLDEPESLPVPAEEQELSSMAILEEDTQSEVTPGTPECDETPFSFGEEAGASDKIPCPEEKDIVDAIPVPKVEEALPDMATTEIPVSREIPRAADVDSPAQKSFTHSLREAVKSLISAKKKEEAPETGTSSLPGSEEAESAQQEEHGSPDTIPPPDVRENIESETVPEEKAEIQDMEPVGIPASIEVPGTAEAEAPALQLFTHSLREAVKSLISAKKKEEAPETGTSSLPGSEEAESAQQEEPGSPAIPTPPEPVVVEFPAISRQDADLLGAITPETGGDIAEVVQQPAAEATPQNPKSPLPSDGTGSQRQTLIAVMAIILVILGIAGAMVYYPQYFATPPAKEPVHLPAPTTPLLQQTPVQKTPVPTQVVIPPDGVWVRVVYPGNYYGWVGNPGSLQGVTGSGDQIYKIPESDGIVQVQIYKDDNSGNTLTVEIYRNGDLIDRHTRSIPMSSIELLIDAKTGNPPGVTSVVTHETNQTGSSGGRVMYF